MAKLKCITLSAGYDLDKEVARKYLEIGKEYTVKKVEVGDWCTDVWLTEFPDISFNSVFFEQAN